MLMGFRDILDAFSRTPEEREKLKESLFELITRETKDEDIDYSDIPEVTDFSNYKPFKPHLDEIRAKNLRIKAEREKNSQIA